MVHSRLLNPLLHRLLLVNDITFYFKTTLKKFKEILSEVLNIFKYMIFQGRQNAFLWSRGITRIFFVSLCFCILSYVLQGFYCVHICTFVICILWFLLCDLYFCNMCF